MPLPTGLCTRSAPATTGERTSRRSRLRRCGPASPKMPTESASGARAAARRGRSHTARCSGLGSRATSPATRPSTDRTPMTRQPNSEYPTTSQTAPPVLVGARQQHRPGAGVGQLVRVLRRRHGLDVGAEPERPAVVQRVLGAAEVLQRDWRLDPGGVDHGARHRAAGAGPPLPAAAGVPAAPGPVPGCGARGPQAPHHAAVAVPPPGEQPLEGGNPRVAVELGAHG